MTISLEKPAAIRVGSRVRVHARNLAHLADSRYLGAEGTVTSVDRAGHFTIQWDDESLQDGSGHWTTLALMPIQDNGEPAPKRPTIDFSDAEIDRSKARAAALAAQSRVVDKVHNDILQEVADGKRVDAYALNAALTQAMSAAATRFEHSMRRRDLTRQIRHLSYIVQAVLENHADDLPAMEPGARSRKIEELSLEIEHAGVVNQTLTRDLTEARSTIRILGRDLTEAKRRAETAEGESAAVKAAYGERVQVLVAERDKVTAERDLMAAGLAYALEMLPPCAKQRVFGYLDGVERS